MANVGPGKTQVGIVLPAESARWLRIEAARTGRTLGEVVDEALDEWRRPGVRLAEIEGGS
jgi:hypothetical protein